MSPAGEDFRHHRFKLPPEAFALGPKGPDAPPRDIVQKKVWHTIVSLSDDVSIRTSDDHGTELKAMVELWASIIDMSAQHHDVWRPAALDVADSLQASAFNALSGYYKASASCLRSVVETVVVATYLQLERTPKEALDWQHGKFEIKFGFACDQLMRNQRVYRLESHLQKEMHYSIFRQQSRSLDAGWARRLFGALSNYAHARPAYSDGELREGSNGPIFVPSSFRRIYVHYLDVCALSYVAAKLCRPDIAAPKASKWIFRSKKIRPSQVSVYCFEYLWELASTPEKGTGNDRLART